MTLADIRGAGQRAMSEGRLARLVADLLTYGGVSAVALACDYGLLVGLVACGLHYLVASILSFLAGMAVAYVLCVRVVFASRRAASRDAEALGFVAVGLAGLVLTQALLYLLVGRCGLPVATAKLPTTGLVFLFNFGCRRGLVFAAAPSKRAPKPHNPARR